MKRPISWDGKVFVLEKQVSVYAKVDGVRAIWDGRQWRSRNWILLNNMENIPGELEDVEVFCGSFKSTISKVRSQQKNPVKIEEVYQLAPVTDDRLYLGTTGFLDETVAGHFMGQARKRGFPEGFVVGMNELNRPLKVKQEETHDVKITGFVEGKGRNVRRLGALLCDHGRVGIGFTDEEREEIWAVRDSVIGMVMEVKSMEMTAGRKFRQPRFIRFRFDK